jgi:hypothetical protein
MEKPDVVINACFECDKKCVQAQKFRNHLKNSREKKLGDTTTTILPASRHLPRTILLKNSLAALLVLNIMK